MNNKYKILLVEDEHNISTLIMTMLESSGYQVIQAGTCALAKTLFVSHCPDLVLLDLGLPDMGGARVGLHVQLRVDAVRGTGAGQRAAHGVLSSQRGYMWQVQRLA